MTGSVFFLEFNHREGRVTDNLNLRRALAAAFDAEELGTECFNSQVICLGRASFRLGSKALKANSEMSTRQLSEPRISSKRKRTLKLPRLNSGSIKFHHSRSLSQTAPRRPNRQSTSRALQIETRDRHPHRCTNLQTATGKDDRRGL